MFGVLLGQGGDGSLDQSMTKHHQHHADSAGMIAEAVEELPTLWTAVVSKRRSTASSRGHRRCRKIFLGELGTCWGSSTMLGPQVVEDGVENGVRSWTARSDVEAPPAPCWRYRGDSQDG